MSRLLEAVHETAKGMYRCGTIDAATMRQYDALCLSPVKTYTPQQIKRLRRKCRLNQAAFAAYMNTSAATVQKWEQGRQTPNGASLKLLSLVEARGLAALDLSGGATTA